MASTLTLQNSITWAAYFVGNRLLGLSPTEPALTSANMVIQVMLSPPFKWRWNRSNVGFTFTGNDTVVSIPDFGFIEKAYSNPSSGPSAGKPYEIPNIVTELSRDGATGKSTSIAPWIDDNLGNITFRFMPGNPDVPSNVTVIYQKKPALMTTLGAVWPIPDEYSFVYNWGFLALMYLFADSEKFGPANQKFVSGLLSLSEGLGEQQIAIFLGQWDFLIQNIIKNQSRSTQGIQARQT